MALEPDHVELGRINRRALLKFAAAGAVLSFGTDPLSAQGLRVVVAGAGIIGASIAYHLARAGAQVTVVDQEGPATHASRGTFAWINATWAKQPRDYHALNQAGLSGWKSLQPLLNIPIRWNGSYLFRLLAYIHLEKERFILIYSNLSKLFASERSTRWNTI